MVCSKTLDLRDSFLGLDNIFDPTGVIDNPPEYNRRRFGFGAVDEDFSEFVQILASNALALDLTSLKSLDQVRVTTSSNAGISTAIPVTGPMSSAASAIIGGMMGFSTTRRRDKIKHL